MSLVDRMKTLCEKNGISVPKLEEELGFSRGAIYKWDDNSPSVAKVQKVARRLGVSIDELIHSENEVNA